MKGLVLQDVAQTARQLTERDRHENRESRDIKKQIQTNDSQTDRYMSCEIYRHVDRQMRERAGLCSA